jgi:hypothetical protein
MRIARPTRDQFDAVVGFLQSLEAVVDRREMPDPDGGEPEPLTDDEALHEIDCLFGTIRPCWERVLHAGWTAIENACREDSHVLEFKPEIARAVQGYPVALAACHAIVNGWGHQDGVSRAVELARNVIEQAE